MAELNSLASLKADAIAYYRFENSALTTDSAGTNTLSNTSVTDTTGKYGGAGAFNGSSAFLTAPDTAALDLTGSHSISCWLNTNVNNTAESIVEKYSGGNGYYFRLDGSGKLVFGNQASAGANSHSVTGNTAVGTNTWRHVVATYDGTNLRVYLDGVSDATAVAHTGANTASTALLNISRRGDSNASLFFNGELDDICIFTKALSQAEITSLFEAGVSSSMFLMF